MDIKVELTENDAANVRIALLALAKSPNINENGMKTLLVLLDKFVVKEEEDVTPP